MKVSAFLLTLCLGIAVTLSFLLHHYFGSFPVVIGLVALVEYFVRQKKLPAFDKGYALLFTAIIVASLFSGLWALVPEDAIWQAGKLSLVFTAGLSLIATAQHYTDDQKIRVLNIMIFALIAAGILFLIEAYSGHPTYRLVKDIPNVNDVPVYVLNWTAIISLCLMWPVIQYTHSSEKPVLTWALFILTLAIVFSSDNQSSMLGILAGLTVFIASRVTRKVPQILLIGLSAGLAVAPWLAQWLFSLKPEVLMKFKIANAAQRMEIWDFLGAKILQKPFLGWGMDVTPSFTLPADNVYFRHEHVLHPHNAALQLWVELGMVGVMIGIAFLAMTLSRLSNIKDNSFMLAAFTTITAISLTGYGLWQGWWLCLMFLTVVLFRLQKP